MSPAEKEALIALALEERERIRRLERSLERASMFNPRRQRRINRSLARIQAIVQKVGAA